VAGALRFCGSPAIFAATTSQKGSLPRRNRKHIDQIAEMQTGASARRGAPATRRGLEADHKRLVEIRKTNQLVGLKDLELEPEGRVRRDRFVSLAMPLNQPTVGISPRFLPLFTNRGIGGRGSASLGDGSSARAAPEATATCTQKRSMAKAWLRNAIIGSPLNCMRLDLVGQAVSAAEQHDGQERQAQPTLQLLRHWRTSRQWHPADPPFRRITDSERRGGRQLPPDPASKIPRCTCRRLP
jgi:hypothetical protein